MSAVSTKELSSFLSGEETRQRNAMFYQYNQSHFNQLWEDMQHFHMLCANGEMSDTYFSSQLCLHAKEHVDRSNISDDTRSLVRSCLGEFQVMLRDLGSGWHVDTFGSMANGFGMNSSDLDVTFYQAEGTSSDKRRDLQEKFLPLFKAHPKFWVVQEVFSAKVPLLKLVFEGKLEVDVSCHNTEPLANTRLLCAYSRLDPVVRDLGVFVKIWATHFGVCGATGGNLSSYSLTLMVIYFLQVHQDLGFPHLPTSAFRCGAENVEEHLASWRFQGSLSFLIEEFFTFFAEQFDWGSEVVSVRLGKRSYATDDDFACLAGRRLNRLHVEDPYFLDKNLNRLLGPDQELKLRQSIAETSRALRQTGAGQDTKPRSTSVSPWSSAAKTAMKKAKPLTIEASPAA